MTAKQRKDVVFWSFALVCSFGFLITRTANSDHRVSTTFELDTGQMVTFMGDRAKCIEARDALRDGSGSTVATVATVSPWGAEYGVKSVWCAVNGALIGEPNP